MTTLDMPVADHPVLNPFALRFQTRPMLDLRNTITQWLFIGATGGCVLGRAQIGKTTAVQWLRDGLKDRTGRTIVSHLVIMPPRDVGSVTSLYRLCCLSADLPVATRDRADHLQSKFVDFLRQITAQAEARSVTLFVDEMQRLTLRQLEAFCELHDVLRWKYGIRLVVIFIGNDQECSPLLERLKSDSCAHVAGRFFRHMTRYHGLKHAGELRELLGQYDTCTAGGKTYTEFFLSDAYNKGFRLVTLADYVWQEYQVYRRKLKIDSWGMGSAIAAVNTLLTDYLPNHDLERLPAEVIQACLDVSGITDTLVRFR